jgi:Tfp pilus assembly protein PilF
MEVLGRIGVSVLMVLSLTGGISYSQSTVEEIYNKGMEYATQGMFKEAKEEFEKALKLDSFCVPAEESLQRVEDFLSRKIKRQTGTYLFRGVVYCNRGDFVNGIGEINKALKINPRYAATYTNRAISYYLKKEYEKAWGDVHKTESLGDKVPPGFLKALREASGRQK